MSTPFGFSEKVSGRCWSGIHHRLLLQKLLVRVFVKVNVNHGFLSPESGDTNQYIQVTKNYKRQKIY